TNARFVGDNCSRINKCCIETSRIFLCTFSRGWWKGTVTLTHLAKYFVLIVAANWGDTNGQSRMLLLLVSSLVKMTTLKDNGKVNFKCPWFMSSPPIQW